MQIKYVFRKKSKNQNLMVELKKLRKNQPQKTL